MYSVRVEAVSEMSTKVDPHHHMILTVEAVSKMSTSVDISISYIVDTVSGMSTKVDKLKL